MGRSGHNFSQWSTYSMETTKSQPAKAKDNGKGDLIRQWQFMQALIADRSLPDSATKVALALLERRNAATGYSFPSFATIAKDAGMGRSTAITAVEALKAGGWFVVEPVWKDKPSGRHKTSNRYRPIWQRASGSAPAMTKAVPVAEVPDEGGWRSGVVEFTAEDVRDLQEQLGDRLPAFLEAVEQRAPDLTEETVAGVVQRLINDWTAPF